MNSQKEKDNNAHTCLYTCIEEWTLFVLFQSQPDEIVHGYGFIGVVVLLKGTRVLVCV